MSKRTQRPSHIQRAFDAHNVQERIIKMNDAAESTIVPAFEKLKEAAMQHEGDVHGNVASELRMLWKEQLQPALADLRTLEKSYSLHSLPYALPRKAGRIGGIMEKTYLMDHYRALANTTQFASVDKAFNEFVDAGQQAVRELLNNEALYRQAGAIPYR